MSRANVAQFQQQPPTHKASSRPGASYYLYLIDYPPELGTASLTTPPNSGASG